MIFVCGAGGGAPAFFARWIAFGHPLLQNPDVRRRFVACESPAGRSVTRGGRTPWRLRSHRGDRPQWWVLSEEVR